MWGKAAEGYHGRPVASLGAAQPILHRSAAQDVPPNATGVLGVFIQILPDGEPIVSAPGRGEGWFGN